MQEKMLKLRLIRLPGITNKTRRLFPFLGLLFLFVLILHLYTRLQLSAAHSCQTDPSWACRAFSFGSSTPSHGDGRPIVDRPEGARALSVWSGGSPMLEGVNGAFSDFWAGLGEGLGRPGVVTSWRYERDADDVDMSRRQCLLAFPGLFVEIERARSRYEKFHIVKEDVAKLSISEGRMRAGILGGKLQILETNLPTPNDRTRALAFLRSINEAVSRSKRTSLPDVEFVISVNPHVPDLTYPMWVPDRRVEDDKVWLMPDMGFVVEEVGTTSAKPSWAAGRPAPKKPGAPPSSKKEDEKTKQGQQAPRVVATSRRQLEAEIEVLERSLPYEAKREKLVGVWRAGAVPDTTRRKALVRVADGQDWAESERKGEQAGVAGIADGSGNDNAGSAKAAAAANLHRSPLSEMCRSAFLAQDDSFGIRLLDGPLLCRSVVFTTRPRWIHPYHGLMLADGDHLHLHDAVHPAVQRWSHGQVGRQNVVVVADDWADLPEKIRGLVASPQAAEGIAANAAETFHRRYLTAAATACYWRELVIAYARVGFKPSVFVEESDAAEGESAGRRLTRRGISFASFLLLDTDTQARFHEEMMLRKT